MTVLPVAPLLAETIMNVFADDFRLGDLGGENQLFLSAEGPDVHAGPSAWSGESTEGLCSVRLYGVDRPCGASCALPHIRRFEAGSGYTPASVAG